MNDFDFSAYDFEDNSPAPKKSASKPSKKTVEFDFDAYETPTPKQEKTYLDTAKDYGKTVLKGTAEGLSRLGRVMSPIQDLHGRSDDQQFQRQSEALNEVLPTTDEGFGQKAIRRGLQQAPTALAFPGSSAAVGGRALLAGFAGQGAEELGLPEWAQTAAELTAYIGPDVTRKLLEKGKNADIIKEARRLGLSDEQITPLIQSEFKQKWLSKLAPKRGSTQRALTETKSGLGNIYESIETSDIAHKPISSSESKKFTESLEKQLIKLPREIRDKVERDAQDLLSAPINGNTLINFWKDLNSHYGPGKEKLGILKEPIKNAIKSISPEMRKDFDTANMLYSKYSGIASKLKPSIASDIISGGEALGFLGALITGNVPFFTGLLTEQAGKKLIQQMLINPRFQQLSKKAISAINENKFALAKKTSDLIAKEVAKIDKNAAKKIESISDEDFKDLIMNSKS
jgi:hypothetical protein